MPSAAPWCCGGYQPQQQYLVEAVDAEQPAGGQPAHDDDLADDTGLLRLDLIHQHAHDDAQQGAGQNRGGHHEALLGGAQAEAVGDLHAQRPQDYPDHEGQVEVEKGAE
jgi:hypothetical protein